MSDALSARTADGYTVTASQVVYSGPIFEVRKDQVRFPDGTSAGRDIVAHGGAVAIVALDAEGRVTMLEQYRHAVGGFLWELPAGLLDVPGEREVTAAERELAEEAGLGARRWHTLLDLISASGFCSERVRVYLAEDLYDVDLVEHELTHEEADLVVRRIPLEECVAAVLDGRIQNSIAAGGILAAARAVADRSVLRDADHPWPAAR